MDSNAYRLNMNRLEIHRVEPVQNRNRLGRGDTVESIN